jgi:hypothetical protein
LRTALRFAAALPVLALLAACSQNTPAPSPSPTSAARSVAADLRTRMDLLLAEQVMIVAKESAAAVNHSDEYGFYTPQLALNSADLSALVSRAFGNTATNEFEQLWDDQNGFLVDYAIGVVTHNDAKANSAMSSLTTSFVPQFTRVVSSMSHLPTDATSQLIGQQVTADKTLIDDVFAADFRGFYADLHRAYAHASRLGDLLAEQMAVDFPDKFPGDPLASAVDTRVSLNLDLQEHSYLATMATDATVNGRSAEKAEAFLALTSNNEAMRSVVDDNRFSLAWSQELGSLSAYALNGDPLAAQNLTNTFVTELAVASKAPRSAIAFHENATIAVVDAQRQKNPRLADDDRAAATSMQPIADSVEG